jgi:hypothetical protein
LANQKIRNLDLWPKLFGYLNHKDNSFKIFRSFILFLSILTCFDMFFLSYFLRPLSWDGARFAFYLIQYGKPFYDSETYRLLASLFQIPAIITQYVFASSSPLVLLRIYFLTLVMLIYGYMTYRIFKAKNLEELVILSTLVFIIFLPAMSFTINVMYETLFFYFLAFESLLNRKYKLFFLFILLSSLGHPSIILGFILFAAIQFYFYLKEKSRAMLGCLIATTIMAITIFIRLLNAVNHDPKSKYFFPDVIKSVVINFSNPSMYSIYAGVVLVIFSLVFILTKNVKYKNLFFIIGSAFLSFYIFNSMDPGFLFISSHGYRVFSLVFSLCLIVFMMYLNYKKTIDQNISIKILLFISTIGIWHLARDININLAQRDLYINLEKIQPKESYCEIHSNIDHRYFPASSIPILKMFIDNNRSVRTIHYVSDYSNTKDKSVLLCEELKENFLPLDYQLLSHGKIDTSSFYGLHIWEKGYFDFKFKK